METRSSSYTSGQQQVDREERAKLLGITVDDDPSRASKGLFEQIKQVVQPAVQYVLAKGSDDTSLCDVFVAQADALFHCSRSALKKVQADRLRQHLPSQAQQGMSPYLPKNNQRRRSPLMAFVCQKASSVTPYA